MVLLPEIQYISYVYNLFFNCHMELAIIVILVCEEKLSHGSFHNFYGIVLTIPH